MDFSDIWDYIVDGFDYLIHFEWLADLKDVVGEFFSSIPDMFTSDSPISSLWFWMFYAFFLFGVWILPSSLGMPDYTLRDKILGSVVFFVLDFFVVGHFKNS